MNSPSVDVMSNKTYKRGDRPNWREEERRRFMGWQQNRVRDVYMYEYGDNQYQQSKR